MSSVLRPPPLNPSRRHLLLGAAATVGAIALSGSRASASPLGGQAPSLILSTTTGEKRNEMTPERVCRWAADTWLSLVAMTDASTGLPADNISEGLAVADRSGYT